MILLNFSDEPVNDFALSLPEGPLDTSAEAQTPFGEADAQAVVLNDSRGFEEYRPLDTLLPQSGLVFQL